MVNKQLYSLEKELLEQQLESIEYGSLEHIFSENLFLTIHGLHKVIDITEKRSLHPLTERFMLCLAHSYEENDNFDEAAYWYKKCLQEPCFSQDAILYTAMISSLILCLLSSEKYDEIAAYIDRLTALDLPAECEQSSELMAVRKLLCAIGGFFRKTEHHAAIERGLLEAKRGYPSGSSDSNFPYLHLLLEEMLGDLANHINDFQKALPHYEKALDASKTYHHMKKELDLHLKMSSVYERSGNLELALQQYKQYYQLSDGICKNKSRQYSEYLLEIYNLGHVESAICQLREMSEKLTNKRNTDFLTGTYNRRFWDETVKYKVQNREFESAPVSILMVDIDNFKKYNDIHGHMKGDEVLKLVGEVLKSSVERNTDLVARYGGEEFIILLDATGLQGSKKIATQILDNIRKLSIPFYSEPSDAVISLSIGISTGLESSISDLIRDADKALYCSKRNGKNTYTHIIDLP